jgi:hypothetical protein
MRIYVSNLTVKKRHGFAIQHGALSTMRGDTMTTRPTDPRGNARRGSDNADLGYGAAIGAAPAEAKRWPAPDTIYKINAFARQRASTGRCVVCGTPTDTPGVTCKATNCVSCWVLGREEPFTVTHERMEY